MAKKTSERLKELQKGYLTLKEAMPVIGASANPPNGLGNLASKVAEATVLNDDTESLVTATGSIYKGDMITITKELVCQGESLRVANGNATLLAVTNMENDLKSEDINAPIIFAFAQDDSTYLKAARWNGNNWVLGATMFMLEGPLDKANMISYQSNWGYSNGSWYLAVLYREDNIGMIQFWSVDDNLSLTHHGTDIWADHAPKNVCGAWTPIKTHYSSFDQYACLITVVSQNSVGETLITGIKPEWRWDETQKKSYLTANLWETKTIVAGAYSGASMLNGKHDDFTVPTADTQEYASKAWSLVAKRGSGAMWLTFPGEDGERYILELWVMEDHTFTPVRDYRYELAGCRSLVLSGYLPCISGEGNLRGGNDLGNTGPYLAGGLGRISGPNLKSALGVENWSGGYECKLLPMWFGEENQRYQANIGLVSIRRLGQKKDCLAVGCCVEGLYRALVLYGRKNRLLGGPGVLLAEVGLAAELVESGAGVALVYQRSDSIFIQNCVTCKVAATTTEGYAADGVAVTGGRGGQTIKIKGFSI